jgi:hypothetical protein
VPSGTGTGPAQSAVDVWLEFALVIEEKQFVSFILLFESHLIFLDRIDIQQRVRRDDDRQQVEKLRTTLGALLAELHRLQTAAGVFQCPSLPPSAQDGQWEDWDTIVESMYQDSPTAEPPTASATANIPNSAPDDPVSPEQQTLCIPSNRNSTPAFDDIELLFRKRQAKTHLLHLRELIAEKSFQYSEVMRVAPTKGVLTRSRGAVKAINLRISFHCQVYGHCRARLIQLGADETTLRQFKELKKEHIKASTAVVAPNARGSTTLQLSWIWQDVSRHMLGNADADLSSTDAATILEC